MMVSAPDTTPSIYMYTERLEAILKATEPILQSAREREQLRKTELAELQQSELSESQKRNISSLVHDISFPNSKSAYESYFDEDDQLPTSPNQTRDNKNAGYCTQGNNYFATEHSPSTNTVTKTVNSTTSAYGDGNVYNALYSEEGKDLFIGEESHEQNQRLIGSCKYTDKVIADAYGFPEIDGTIQQGTMVGTTEEGCVEQDPTASLSDWSERFRKVIADLAEFDNNTTMKKRISVNYELLHLSRDFLLSARSYGKIIISEVYLPLTLKTIQPVNIGGIAGGEKYMVRNILFKFCVDNKGLYGSDEHAAKVAGHELKGLMSYYNCWIPNLYVPMMAVIDYRGFRLTAVSRLPISPETFVYGTNNGGNTYKFLSPELDRKLGLAAKMLNITTHEVGQGVILSTAADVEGHCVKGKYYLIDLARVLPPEACTRDRRKKCEYLYKLLRSELLKMYNIPPLCSDTYSGFLKGTKDEKKTIKDVIAATKVLYEIAIPGCAVVLINIVKEEWNSWNERKGREGQNSKDLSWRKGGYLKLFKMKQLVHSRGVNLRHLGKVAEAVRRSKLSARELVLGKDKIQMQSHYSSWEDEHGWVFDDLLAILWIEMCARTLRKLLNGKLREEMKRVRAPLEQPFNLLVVNFLNQVFGKTEDSETFWNGQFKDKLIDKFGVVALSSFSLDAPGNPSLKGHLEKLFIRQRGKIEQGSSGPQENYEAPERFTGIVLLFSKLCKLVGIQFEEHAMSQYLGVSKEMESITSFHSNSSHSNASGDGSKGNNKKKNRLSPAAPTAPLVDSVWMREVPFDAIDYVSSGEYVKHMNMIHHAQGYVFKTKAMEELRTGRGPRTELFFKRALKNFEVVLDSDPTNKITLRNCGQVLSYLNNLCHPEDEVALKHIARGKQGASATVNRKTRYDGRHLLKKAAEYYRRAIQSDPADSYSLYQYATFLYRTGMCPEEKEEAEEFYLKSLEADPTHLAALSEYSLFLNLRGHVEIAKKVTARYNTLKSPT